MDVLHYIFDGFGVVSLVAWVGAAYVYHVGKRYEEANPPAPELDWKGLLRAYMVQIEINCPAKAAGLPSPVSVMISTDQANALNEMHRSIQEQFAHVKAQPKPRDEEEVSLTHHEKGLVLH